MEIAPNAAGRGPLLWITPTLLLGALGAKKEGGAWAVQPEKQSVAKASFLLLLLFNV